MAHQAVRCGAGRPARPRGGRCCSPGAVIGAAMLVSLFVAPGDLLVSATLGVIAAVGDRAAVRGHGDPGGARAARAADRRAVDRPPRDARAVDARARGRADPSPSVGPGAARARRAAGDGDARAGAADRPARRPRAAEGLAGAAGLRGGAARHGPGLGGAVRGDGAGAPTGRSPIGSGSRCCTTGSARCRGWRTSQGVVGPGAIAAQVPSVDPTKQLRRGAASDLEKLCGRAGSSGRWRARAPLGPRVGRRRLRTAL